MRRKVRDRERMDVREWLANSDRKVGSVVHTIDAGKPVKATRLEDGSWKLEAEEWAHGEA